MKIRSAAIVGAGAVGSYLIWGLSQKKDVSLCVIADGERKTRFERDGFVINNVTYHPPIKTPEEAKGVDLIFVTVKYGALSEAEEILRRMVDENTLVVSLMNGVDSEERLGAAVGASHILPALIKISSERKGNTVRFDPAVTIGMIFGETDADAGTRRTDALCELFTDTGLHYRVTDRILGEIWSKYRLNVTCNQPQAIIGCGLGAYLDSEHVAFISRKLGEEVDAIAKAKGIDIIPFDHDAIIGTVVTRYARYSTLQDLDAHRHTEVDMFAGAMIRMGKELGIPTPYSEFTYHAIKALEEKNDGKFEYK